MIASVAEAANFGRVSSGPRRFILESSLHESEEATDGHGCRKMNADVLPIHAFDPK
jgi:hypothetical protein